jgi:hypothetical protein
VLSIGPGWSWVGVPIVSLWRPERLIAKFRMGRRGRRNVSSEQTFHTKAAGGEESYDYTNEIKYGKTRIDPLRLENR